MTYYSANPFLPEIMPDPDEEDYSNAWRTQFQNTVQSRLHLRAATRNGHNPRTERDIRVRLHPDRLKSHQKSVMNTSPATPWTTRLDNPQTSPALSPSTVSSSPEAAIGTPWIVSRPGEDAIFSDTVVGLGEPLWSTTLDNTQMSYVSSPSTISTSSGSIVGTPWPVSRLSEDSGLDDTIDSFGNSFYLEQHTTSMHVTNEAILSSEMQVDEVTAFPSIDVGGPEAIATGKPVKQAKRAKDAKQTSSVKKKGGLSGRGPGRPPNPNKPAPSIKKAKVRTKTGCTTCRRRKKKCDEAKPSCRACRRIGHDCEFPAPQPFQKGNNKKRAGSVHSCTETEISRSDSEYASAVKVENKRIEEASDVQQEPEMIASSKPSILVMPTLFREVETDADEILFAHCDRHLSRLWFDEPKHNDALKRMAFQVATHDSGVMHSMLAFAGQHINYSSPEAKDLLKDYPMVTIRALERRTQYHIRKAQITLKDRMGLHSKDKDLSAAKLQLVFGLFSTLNKPVERGEHRTPLSLYQGLCAIASETPEIPELDLLMTQIIDYHKLADQLIYLPKANMSYYQECGLTSIAPPDVVNLLGMAEGTFAQLLRITRLRNQIRTSRNTSPLDSKWKYQEQFEAASIEGAIDKRMPAWPMENPYELLKPLYNLMALIYLYRTMHLPEETNWGPNSDLLRCVDDAIKLLRLVDPSSGLQTFLLMPTFIIGCAAFEVRQRQEVRTAVKRIKSYRGFKNADSTLAVLEQVWRLMDAKDPISWDWEYIAHHMGCDDLPV